MNSKPILHNFFFKTLPVIISIIFHPLVMPAFGIYILLYTDNPASFLTDDSKRIVFTVAALSTIGLPTLLLVLTSFKKLNSIHFLSEREERIAPLIIISVIYYLNYYLMRQMGVPVLIQIFCLATIFSIIFTLFVNLFWKISTHMIGLGGITAMILFLTFFYGSNTIFYLLFIILAAGITGFSRLSLNAHTPAQIYTGFLGGCITVFISCIYFL